MSDSAPPAEAAPGRRFPFDLCAMVLLFASLAAAYAIYARWERWAKGELLEGWVTRRSAYLPFTPDGCKLVTYQDKDVFVWDAYTGKQLLTFRLPGEKATFGVGFSPDGSRVVASVLDFDGVYFFDAETGQVVLQLQKDAEILTIESFSPDGTRLVTEGDMRTHESPNRMGGPVFRLWDAQSGRELAVLRKERAHYSGGIGVVFSPDGTRVADMATGHINIWDTETGRILKTVGTTGSYDNYTLRYSPDGRHLAATTTTHPGSRGIRLFDLDAGRPSRLIGYPRQSPRASTIDFAFSPDGRHMAVADTLTWVGVWDVDTGEKLWDRPTGTDWVRLSKGRSRSFRQDVFYTPDGTRIVMRAGMRLDGAPHGEYIGLWDAQTGRPVDADVDREVRFGYATTPSPNGEVLAVRETAETGGPSGQMTRLFIRRYPEGIQGHLYRPEVWAAILIDLLWLLLLTGWLFAPRTLLDFRWPGRPKKGRRRN